jgi:hypothetical protein
MFYDSFDKKENFLRNWQARNLYPKMIKSAGILNDNGINALEIGYGRGEFHKIFMQMYPQTKYTVIDANNSICETAKKNGCVATYQTFLPSFPEEIAKESFDLIIMNNILEHLNNWQHVEKVLAEKLKPILSKNGRIIIFVPDYLDWGEDFFEVDYSHSYICTRSRINRLLLDCDYNIISNDYFRSAFNNFRIFFWFLAKTNNLIFGFILHITGNLWKRNFLYKCKIAFNRCIFVVAELNIGKATTN